MTDKLFTSNKKSILFNLIGFDHRYYFELARKIEQHGGKVSLPDKFNPEAMTIVNTDICYTLKYILDSIENDSLVDAQNYCLKYILESITENNNNKNNSCDDLSITTMASEGDIFNDQTSSMFFEDKCLEESPDLLHMESEVTDEETDEEVIDETSDRNLTAMRETVEEVGRRQSPSHSLVNETFQSDDNDDIVPNSDDETIRRYESHNSAKRQWNDGVDSSSSESGEDSHKTNKRRKIARSVTLSSTSDVDLTDDSEDQPERSEEPLDKSDHLNKKKTMIVMNRTTYLCSPPTSDDESAEDTNTDKIRRKKKSMKNKNLRNKVPNEIIESKANTNEELQQQKAPDKTKCNTQETHRNNVELNSDTNFPDTLDDRVNNPSISSEAELVNPIHAKWLDDHQKRIEEFKNFKGRKGDYYSKSEEIGIFWWLIKNDKIDQVGSEGTFKQLIEDGYLTHRSCKGIYNHFRRQMLSRLPAFKLPDDIYKKLKLYVNGLQSI
ncbi:uncharacterized protein LOC123274581 isoform X2 [Cotesia glomerata]|uniref:uncharacterized protein LOC123274581 isoform X2 n=1 Tax=Cotesia glomerata TaxID=32391 RepID=UPI001D02B41B|nr:uncharacterized protein LOC123274581 isoform X2 [Cotesia glomerata]